MTSLAFAKMHGLGNDFVVLERVGEHVALDVQQMQRLSDRRLGVGYDQLLCLGPGRSGASFSLSIFNADGSPAQQCGNGVRCVALYARRAGLIERDEFCIESSGQKIDVALDGEGHVRCSMGVPSFTPRALPFQAEQEQSWYDISVGPDTVRLGAVSMGNPHAVIEVPDVDDAPVARIGPLVESHPRFPQRVNVGFMQIIDTDAIRLRVFERGVGETRACGTGACAAVAVGRKNGLLDDAVSVTLPGGELRISWGGGCSPVWMTGPATWVYEGTIEV